MSIIWKVKDRSTGQYVTVQAPPVDEKFKKHVKAPSGKIVVERGVLKRGEREREGMKLFLQHTSGLQAAKAR